MIRNEPLDFSTGFAVPFVSVQHPNASKLNADLRSLFLARELEGDRYRNQQASMRINPGLFESNFKLFQWPEACVRELRDFCYQAVLRVIADISQQPRSIVQRLNLHADSWFHITRNGGFFGLHTHAMASWSGVYCVDPGDKPPQNSQSGALMFPHPVASATMFSDLTNVNLKPPYALGEKHFYLKPGQLLIFPSWLSHQVLPYLGERERITVAFNSWYRLKTM